MASVWTAPVTSEGSMTKTESMKIRRSCKSELLSASSSQGRSKVPFVGPQTQPYHPHLNLPDPHHHPTAISPTKLPAKRIGTLEWHRKWGPRTFSWLFCAGRRLCLVSGTLVRNKRHTARSTVDRNGNTVDDVSSYTSAKNRNITWRVWSVRRVASVRRSSWVS